VTLIANHLELLLRSLDFEPHAVVLCGQGEFLARAVLDRLALCVETGSAREKIGERLSEVGPAYALAMLAEERSHG
jgi:uncharacterized hydantoinase/oxoprolinase family protein